MCMGCGDGTVPNSDFSACGKGGNLKFVCSLLIVDYTFNGMLLLYITSITTGELQIYK